MNLMLGMELAEQRQRDYRAERERDAVADQAAATRPTTTGARLQIRSGLARLLLALAARLDPQPALVEAMR